ncbi:unnamed protein product [Vitrella brassicaformis CCMP3155]|uniref:Cyclic nucleotide-binding domain-containing protein n=2 Tax=Vitrella brassicaformis TaxID=1169539 RepID=A0A0G4GNS6_VITBC|nr:unnamed protein product [Vitrella brassicaformis CCMP3155]|eukprot:CEM31819.1 unnamed protein product [Vitrella brassicaformis CCMP3155]
MISRRFKLFLFLLPCTFALLLFLTKVDFWLLRRRRGFDFVPSFRDTRSTGAWSSPFGSPSCNWTSGGAVVAIWHPHRETTGGHWWHVASYAMSYHARLKDNWDAIGPASDLYVLVTSSSFFAQLTPFVRFILSVGLSPPSAAQSIHFLLAPHPIDEQPLADEGHTGEGNLTLLLHGGRRGDLSQLPTMLLPKEWFREEFRILPSQHSSEKFKRHAYPSFAPPSPALQVCAKVLSPHWFGSEPKAFQVNRGDFFQSPEDLARLRQTVDAICPGVSEIQQQVAVRRERRSKGEKDGQGKVLIYQRDRTRRIMAVHRLQRALDEGLGGREGDSGWSVDVFWHDNRVAPCELVRRVADSDVLVTAHGFHLTLLLFMTEGSLAYEMFPKLYYKGAYIALARSLHLSLHQRMCRRVQRFFLSIAFSLLSVVLWEKLDASRCFHLAYWCRYLARQDDVRFYREDKVPMDDVTSPTARSSLRQAGKMLRQKTKELGLSNLRARIDPDAFSAVDNDGKEKLPLPKKPSYGRALSHDAPRTSVQSFLGINLGTLLHGKQKESKRRSSLVSNHENWFPSAYEMARASNQLCKEHYVLPPDALIRSVVDFSLVCISFFYAAYLAFAFSFVPYETVHVSWFIADNVVDFLFFLEITLNFVTAYAPDMKELESVIALYSRPIEVRKCLIALKYIFGGGFLRDVITSFPLIDVWALLLLNIDGKSLGIIMTPINTPEGRQLLRTVATKLRLCRIIRCACLLFYVGGSDCQLPTQCHFSMVPYLNKDYEAQGRPDDYPWPEQPPTLRAYLATLFYVLTLFHGQGYDLQKDTSNEEVATLVAIMIIGAVLLGSIFGEVAAHLSRINAEKKSHYAKMNMLEHTMKELQLDPSLQSKLRDFFQIRFDFHRHENQVEETKTELISEFPALSDVLRESKLVAQKITLHLKVQVYLPGDVLCNAFQKVSKIIFFLEGRCRDVSVAMLNNKNKPGMAVRDRSVVLGQGQNMNEIVGPRVIGAKAVTMQHPVYTTTLVATEPCETHELCLSDYYDIKLSFLKPSLHRDALQVFEKSLLKEDDSLGTFCDDSANVFANIPLDPVLLHHVGLAAAAGTSMRRATTFGGLNNHRHSGSSITTHVPNSFLSMLSPGAPFSPKTADKDTVSELPPISECHRRHSVASSSVASGDTASRRVSQQGDHHVAPRLSVDSSYAPSHPSHVHEQASRRVSQEIPRSPEQCRFPSSSASILTADFHTPMKEVPAEGEVLDGALAHSADSEANKSPSLRSTGRKPKTAKKLAVDQSSDSDDEMNLFGDQQLEPEFRMMAAQAWRAAGKRRMRRRSMITQQYDLDHMEPKEPRATPAERSVGLRTFVKSRIGWWMSPNVLRDTEPLSSPETPCLPNARRKKGDDNESRASSRTTDGGRRKPKGNNRRDHRGKRRRHTVDFIKQADINAHEKKGKGSKRTSVDGIKKGISPLKLRRQTFSGISNKDAKEEQAEETPLDDDLMYTILPQQSAPAAPIWVMDSEHPLCVPPMPTGDPPLPTDSPHGLDVSGEADDAHGQGKVPMKVWLSFGEGAGEGGVEEAQGVLPEMSGLLHRDV